MSQLPFPNMNFGFTASVSRSQTIRKPHPKSITQAARKNRPRDFDSIISGELDHLRACCTTLRWYLSLVVDASLGLARRDDFLFCFFLDEMAKNAHVLLVLVNEPRSSIKGADGNLYLGKWDQKHTAHGRYFRKSIGWTSGFLGEFWSFYKTELSVTINDITWRHESMSSHKCCLKSFLKKISQL